MCSWMDKHELFDLWSPAQSAWSPWVKPVLFAALPRPLPEIGPQEMIDASWLPRGKKYALVVDPPGRMAVAVGVRLSRVGIEVDLNAVLGAGTRPVCIFTRSGSRTKIPPTNSARLAWPCIWRCGRAFAPR